MPCQRRLENSKSGGITGGVAEIEYEGALSG